MIGFGEFFEKQVLLCVPVREKSLSRDKRDASGGGKLETPYVVSYKKEDYGTEI